MKIESVNSKINNSNQNPQFSYYEVVFDREIETNSPDIAISHGNGAEYYQRNSGLGDCWVLHPSSNPSYIEVSFPLTKAQAENPSLSFSLTHFVYWSFEEYWSEFIQINGHELRGVYAPNGMSWEGITFGISPFVHEGMNTLRISLRPSAESDYMIKSLSIGGR